MLYSSSNCDSFKNIIKVSFGVLFAAKTSLLVSLLSSAKSKSLREKSNNDLSSKISSDSIIFAGGISISFSEAKTPLTFVSKGLIISCH